jgi:hypothetical protein
VNSAIKELRYDNVLLITTQDLIGYCSKEETITVPAVKVEHKEKAELSFVTENFEGLYLPFRDVALDRHGTFKAAANLLCRRFRWEKVGKTARGTSMWDLREKFPEDSDLFDLWIIAHWEGWNLLGVRWKSRHSDAENGKASIGKMQLEAFKRRCERIGLEYPF